VGFDWLADAAERFGLSSQIVLAAGDFQAEEEAMMALNAAVIRNSDAFFGYATANRFSS